MSKRAKKGMPSLPGLPGLSSPGPPEIKSGVDWIEEMVGALCDPIMVFPAGGWENDLPERLKSQLPMHRLMHVNLCAQGKAEWDEATDIEALLYMYPRTLQAPLGEQWTRIYMHLGTKVMGDTFPEDLRVEELSGYDQRALRDLKRWIQTKKVEARKARRRKEKAAQKPEVEPIECERPRLF